MGPSSVEARSMSRKLKSPRIMRNRVKMVSMSVRKSCTCLVKFSEMVKSEQVRRGLQFKSIDKLCHISHPSSLSSEEEIAQLREGQEYDGEHHRKTSQITAGLKSRQNSRGFSRHENIFRYSLKSGSAKVVS